MTTATASTNAPYATCAVLLIGDELLSGRTPDANLNYIAKRMAVCGIRLQECRVVGDAQQAIVDAVNELRARYTYVFTTGGIGPTHDDITVAALAKAFHVKVLRDPEVEQAFHDHFGSRVTPEMLKMADFPEGATLVHNAVSVAPGFCVENVYAFAGIPKVMQSMLEAVIPTLEHGPGLIARQVRVDARESVISKPFEAIQQNYTDVGLGSYPAVNEGEKGLVLVASGYERERVDAAFGEIMAMLRGMEAPILEVPDPM